MLFANASEAAALARSAGPEKLLELASCVVIKEGPAGCRVLWRGPGTGVEQIAVATAPVAAADTTGAGDAFAAGFLSSLLGAGAGPGAATDPASRRWSAAVLRRAALAGHRSAADLLRSRRPELSL